MATVAAENRALGRKIRLMREQAGIRDRGRKYTQPELAARLGTTKGSVSNWERGLHVTTATVALVEAELRFSLADDTQEITDISFDAALERLRAADLELAHARQIISQMAAAQPNPRT